MTCHFFVAAEDICEIRFMLDKECNADSMISVRHPGDVYVSVSIMVVT